MEVVAVAAVAENGVIGNDGELPWPRIPADKRQYRARVADAPIILGRRTFESMREDLPGARQVVLSRDPTRSYPEPSASVVDSIENAIELLAQEGAETAYVLGGGTVYDVSFPYLDRIYVSRVPGRYAGNTTFPAIDPSQWELTETEPRKGFTIETWVRKTPRAGHAQHE